jgi:hypothetical protein
MQLLAIELEQKPPNSMIARYNALNLMRPPKVFGLEASISFVYFGGTTLPLNPAATSPIGDNFVQLRTGCAQGPGCPLSRVKSHCSMTALGS